MTDLPFDFTGVRLWQDPFAPAEYALKIVPGHKVSFLDERLQVFSDGRFTITGLDIAPVGLMRPNRHYVTLVGAMRLGRWLGQRTAELRHLLSS